MTDRPIVLVVDDEPAALEGIALAHSKCYDIRVATSGDEGLTLAESISELAVVISDMRMPGMDGATFLARMKDERPDAVRLLLTGHADADSAARAINEGRIFRFMTKPCAPPEMAEHLGAAVEMHRLITAERVLLQETLVGSVKAVANLLGLANPRALGRALRVQDRAHQAAKRLSTGTAWGMEFAALFSQLAAVFLPQATSDKIYAGQPLTNSELAQLAASIADISEILSAIPRLESVTATLDALSKILCGHTATGEITADAALDASLLHAIDKLESLESTGLGAKDALDELRRGENTYGSSTLTALAEIVDDNAGDTAGHCAVAALTEGMVLAEDLKTTEGLVLLPRGFELTRSTREHVVTPFLEFLPARVKVHTPPTRRGPADPEQAS